MQNNPNTNSNSNINIDDLVKQIYTLYPHLSSDNEEADEALRKKLHLQFIVAVPQVKLKHQDLKCIIMNVKKSLCEFQKRIDESVAQQQLRRTTRVRRTIHQDPQVVNFFNHGHKYEKPNASATCNTKCCHPVSDLGELVQVESLPVSASTNLLTIFVPSILQEQLHSCKYKISIDLNRMDLTKKIIDLNLEQQANSNLEPKEETLKAIDENKDDQECKLTYEITGNTVTNSTMQVLETQITNSTENNPKVELKFSPNTGNSSPSLESTILIETDAAIPKKKRGAKRKSPKAPSTDPPKKRGRKLGSKNKKKDEKSEIAKYVEMFACNAASPSNVSQLVTSTTQNWDALPDQGQIAYFMNGEWTTLSAPINACSQLGSTNNETGVNLEETVGGSETYIPFEDFVNYIDNPSIDVGNNVIARVLAGSVDAPVDNPSPLNPHVMTMSSGTLQTVTSEETINAIQNKPSTSKALDIDIVHSAIVTKKTNASGGALNLSKDFDISFNVNVLDLTHKQVKNTTSSFEKEVHTCNRDDNAFDKTVVFSTNRNMPLLDEMEGDMFTSTTVERGEVLEKRVVFSIAPNASPESSNKDSPDGDSVTDSAIEIDRRDTTDYTLNTPKAPKDKTKAEVIKGMSLLEIEKDIDDSLLDFETCLDDDLLSLAPSSCFNSPNEDRFSESHFMDIDEAKCSTFINRTNSSSAPAPRSQLELNFPKPNEDDLNPLLKTFKIPRVKPIEDEPSRDLPPAKMPTAPQHDLSNTGNPTACPGGGQKPIFAINAPSTNTTESITATSALSQAVSTREISKIFGSLCFDFLADNCFAGTCKLRHQLLELNVMVTSLSLLRNEVLHCAYRFIWRHYKLFKFYFPIFCEEYARRNLRRKLASMITDCLIQPACLLFLRKIHSALVCSGLNKINACRFILNRVNKERSQAAIDILLEIIIDSDASMFTSAIEQYSQTSGYKFRMTDINQLATACLRSGSAELITVLIKCLISVDQADFATMRSPELIQLLEMIKNGGIDGL